MGTDKTVKVVLAVGIIAAVLAPSPDKRFSDKLEEPAEVVEAAAESREQRPLYDVPLSNEVQRYIFNVSDYYGIEPSLIVAIIEKESSYNEAAIGDGGESYGLMQVQGRVWSVRMDELGVTDLLNPYENIAIGVDILAAHLEQGLGVEWALMAYNGGVSYANKMTAEGKVSKYAQSVLEIKERIKNENEQDNKRNEI